MGRERRTVQIATLPNRLDCLRKTVASLYDQVDGIFVMLNGHSVYPVVYDPEDKIEYELLDNQWGDGAKLYNADKREGFVFLCDDDLIYPKSYCDDMIAAYERHKGDRGCIVTLHGKIMSKPIGRSHGGYKEVYRCLNKVAEDKAIEIGGTGVMMFNTKDIKFSTDDIKRKNMCDIWVSKVAKEKGIPIYVIAHPHGYLDYMQQTSTIWNSHTKEDDAYEARILRTFLK